MRSRAPGIGFLLFLIAVGLCLAGCPSFTRRPRGEQRGAPAPGAPADDHADH